MTSWVVRAGLIGERDEWALTSGLAGGGFNQVPDLTSAISQEDIASVVAQSFVGEGNDIDSLGQLCGLPARARARPISCSKYHQVTLCCILYGGGPTPQ